VARDPRGAGGYYREYQLTYLDVESAKVEEQQAITNGDVDAELAASHKLIQGPRGDALAGAMGQRPLLGD
jgi:hypothetical protein